MREREESNKIFTLAPYSDPVTGRVDLYNWSATMIGPADTPYAGGNFMFDIRIPAEYPRKPPLVALINYQAMYHPNFGEYPANTSNATNYSSNVCIDFLKDNWSPAYTLSKIMHCLSALLDAPNPDDALNQGAAALLKSDPQRFSQTARERVRKHAN
jgi:ubiquitin-conjugating enzyme E2 D/E